MPPITLLIKPASGACNMRCKYCFYADVMDNRSVSNFGMLSDELHETMVKNALAEGEGSVTFAFQGGEPTLRGLDFFQRHVKLIEKHNVKKLLVYNTIQTNDYVIDDQWASFLADNNSWWDCQWTAHVQFMTSSVLTARGTVLTTEFFVVRKHWTNTRWSTTSCALSTTLWQETESRF